MARQFTLSKYIMDCLKANKSQKMTAREIAEWIYCQYPEECKLKQLSSKATIVPLDTQDALINQIVSEIGSRHTLFNGKKSFIKMTEERPRKYYFTQETDEEEIQQAEKLTLVSSNVPEEKQVSEHQLYPLLAKFLESEFGIVSKRIDEKTSSNTQGTRGNQWLHPDLVSLENLSKEWHEAVKKCVEAQKYAIYKLWSFEVKLMINRSNVRECFFQTVSNSSWANFSYLVASDITGRDTMKELRLLSGLHGVGVIRLNVENPHESEILIPAKERTTLDWDAISRLVEENSDFKEFINLIRHFSLTGDIQKKSWDYNF